MKRLISYILLTISSVQVSMAQPICNVTEYGESNGLAQWHVTQVLQDKQGMIWMSTWNGLNRFDGKDFDCFKSQAGDGCDMHTDRLRNIWIDSNDNIQCLTDDGCFEFNTRTYTFSKSDSIKNRPNKSWSLGKKKYFEYTDNYGTEWLIYGSGKLEYIDKKTGKAVNYNIKGIPDNTKFCFNDKQGNLWLFGNYNTFKLSFGITPTESLPQKEQGEIRSLMLDNKNRYWVANKDNKTIRLFTADNTFAGYLGRDGRIHKSHTPFGHAIYSMTQTTNGTIWLGSKPNGLFKLTETSNGTFSIENINGLNNSNIYDIKEDAKGRLWIATLGGGINCIVNPNAASPRVVNNSNGFGNHPKNEFLKVRNLLIVNNKTLIASTTDGLMIVEISDDGNIRNTRFHRHTRDTHRASSISSNATMLAAKDQQGRIFVCTESGGLNLITSENLFADTLSFKHYNTRNGLPTDVMLTATSFDGQLLLTCSNRLILLNPDDTNHTAFDSRFFKRQCHFSDALPLQLPDGRWLFATHRGAFIIDKSELKKSNFIPPIAITSISIENKRTEMAVNGIDTLILDKNERNTTINFAALDYSYDRNISYAFRLMEEENSDAKWNNIGNDRSVTLLNLHPSTYQLEIRSTNGDGVWTDNTRTLTIIVEPKFHETVVARILFLLIAIAAISIIAFTIIYIRRLNHKQHETLKAYLALLEKNDNNILSTKEADTADDEAVKTQSSAYSQHSMEESPEDDAFMRRVIAFVEENIGNANVSIGDMAEAAAVSRSGLQRKMKHMMGITPLDFLREARIKRACQLLQTTTKPISDIAYECGFSDPKYFSRSFKASTGKSPSDYRK